MKSFLGPVDKVSCVEKELRPENRRDSTRGACGESSQSVCCCLCDIESRFQGISHAAQNSRDFFGLVTQYKIAKFQRFLGDTQHGGSRMYSCSDLILRGTRAKSRKYPKISRRPPNTQNTPKIPVRSKSIDSGDTFEFFAVR